MKDKREFLGVLRSVHGLPATEYARLIGDYDFLRYVIHVRKTPVVAKGAAVGVFVVHVPQLIAGFPAELMSTPMRRTALEDYLIRRLVEAAERHGATNRRGGAAALLLPPIGREVLPRSMMVVAADYVEARLRIRLPLRDGMVDADAAERLFFRDLPVIVNESLIHCYLDEEDVAQFVVRMEDAEHARRQLMRRGLVAFIGEGAQPDPALPPIRLPETGLTELDVPNAGVLRGLGVPTGVTLIIGDPYSGRQALVAALAAGVYNHAVGDGREAILSVPDLVRVDTDPGRSIQQVDVSPFLPSDKTGRHFTTASATPAESQMAGVMEAIQVGAHALALDESTSDPAFLGGDGRLGGLRPDAPVRFLSLAARAREIANDLRVSLIVGAFAHAEEFLGVADTVLLLEDGKLIDATPEARRLERRPPLAAAMTPLPSVSEKTRWIIPGSIDPSLGVDEASIEAPEAHVLRFGRYTVNLAGVSQLIDAAQTAAIGLLLYHARIRHLDQPRTVAELMDLLDEDLMTEGLDMLTRDLRGDLARPRRYEIAAALNRLTSLRILRQPPPA